MLRCTAKELAKARVVVLSVHWIEVADQVLIRRPVRSDWHQLLLSTNSRGIQLGKPSLS